MTLVLDASAAVAALVDTGADDRWARRQLASDGWYVALAESLQADLVTLDRRLIRASGCRCEFRCPD